MKEIPSIILEPKTSAQASVIWLHGLGADGHDFANIVPELFLPENLAVRFIFPHAPVRPVTINQGLSMPAWYDIYSLGNLDREDIPGMKVTSTVIDQLIQQEQQKNIPAEKIILAGFSQGGAMALFAGLRYPKKLAGILALSCYLPVMQSLKSEANKTNADTSILLLHGTQDPVIPVQLGNLTYQYLKEFGYSVEWKDYPMAHMVCAPELRDIGTWITLKLV